MFRRILGYALLAVLVLLAIRVAFAVLGTVLGLAMTLLVFAAVGYIMYLILRVFSPATAARVRELMGGRPNKPA
jgi:UPF0716 family protein affecting phage T7 exclusion